MCNTNNSQYNTFSVRVTEDMQNMLSYLQEKKTVESNSNN